jgi:hypothetical protein
MLSQSPKASSASLIPPPSSAHGWLKLGPRVMALPIGVDPKKKKDIRAKFHYNL